MQCCLFDSMDIRVGQGIDCHQLEKNIPFIIGGIEIDANVGIKGHSDGDVLIHSIVDALLGSLSLGDIGSHFSDSPKWKNCSSHIFLNEALSQLKNNNYKIINIDSTIILQEPKINKYISQIKENLSKIINIDSNNISVKATTTDYLGFIGKGEGIAAITSVLICRDNK